MNHWAWPRTFNVQMASEVRTSFIIWLIFQPCLIASTGELRNPESGIHRLAPMLGSSGSSNQSYNCIWWLLNVLPGVCWSSLGWSRGGLHCLVVVTTEQWELRPPCGIQTTILHNTPSIWEWCIPFIYSDLVDGLLLFCLHWWHIYIYIAVVFVHPYPHWPPPWDGDGENMLFFKHVETIKQTQMLRDGWLQSDLHPVGESMPLVRN